MGFILAAAGSAVGLGNLWRFPYLAAKYGGGSFLLIYVILAVTFGFALMITEIALGRKTGKSALYAFSTLHEKCGFIGILASIVPIIILPYYCVIGGWVIKFAWAFLTGSGNAAAADDYFSNFIAKTGEPVMWLVIFILATSVVILLGVNKGIENISKVLMPLLVVLSVIIAVFVVTRPGGKVKIFHPYNACSHALAFFKSAVTTSVLQNTLDDFEAFFSPDEKDLTCFAIDVYNHINNAFSKMDVKSPLRRVQNAELLARLLMCDWSGFDKSTPAHFGVTKVESPDWMD